MSFRQRCCFEAFNGLAPRAWEELNVQPRSSAGLWGFLLLALLCAPALAAFPASQTAPAATPLEAADRQFDAKSYAAALEGYHRVLASGVELGDRRPEVEYRYAVSLGKAERWDEGFARYMKVAS